MRRWGSAPTMVHTNLSQMQWNSLSVLTTALNADDTCLVTHVAFLLTAGGAGLLGALALAVVHRHKLERCAFSEGLIADARLSTPAERDSNLCNWNVSCIDPLSYSGWLRGTPELLTFWTNGTLNHLVLLRQPNTDQVVNVQHKNAYPHDEKHIDLIE